MGKRIGPYKTKAVGSSTAIESIEIAYDWKVDQYTGKGIWQSKGERILEGAAMYPVPDRIESFWVVPVDTVTRRDAAGGGRIGMFVRDWQDPHLCYQVGREIWVGTARDQGLARFRFPSHSMN